MEDDLFELGGLLFERHLQVGVVEEFRVRQTRGEDLAIALDDLRPAVVRGDVSGTDEGVGERPIGAAADEIFLVHARGELDHLGRHVEKRGVELAEQRNRPFGEPGILGDETLVVDEFEPGLHCGLASVIADQRRALVLVDDHVAGAQLLDIVVRAADRDLVRVVEAVAERGGAALDAGDLERHDLFAEQRDDALQRADPAQAFGAGGGVAPAHRLGPRERADDRGDRLGQHGGGGAAGLFGDREQRAAAIDQLLAREAGLTEEPFERLRGGRRLGALHLFGDGGGLDRQVARDQRQAARRRIGDERAGGDAGLGELSGEQLGEILACLGLHPCRDFFGAEFKKEIGHARRSIFAPSRLCVNKIFSREGAKARRDKKD